MNTRIIALVRKEFLALVRDKRSRMILIMPPLMQLIIFAFAITLEVKNNTLTIFNEDAGAHSAELINRFTHIGAFSELRYAFDTGTMQADIDHQESLIALHIPANFSSRLERREPVTVQAIVDGRRANSGQIALGYLNQIIAGYGAELVPTAARNGPGNSEVVVRHWFNPNLRYLWFTIPALSMILTTLITMIITALSVARERELGTFDQMLVSPLAPGQILLGKAIPAFLVAIIEGSVVIAVGTLLYGVPFRGSLILLYLSLSAYLISLVGIGLFISSLCKTQQQAILGVFSFLLPAILLSGYATPIDNMPRWLQVATLVNPMRHFFIVAKGEFLKALDPGLVWSSTWPMLLIAGFTLTAAYWLFRHKLD